jgi:hypothetical protein
MVSSRTIIPVALALLVGSAAQAQETAAPRTATIVASPNASVNVTATPRAGESALVNVRADGANVRDVLREIASRGGVEILLAPSVSGQFTGMIDSQPVERAITVVSATTGLTVRRFAVPAAGASELTADSAGRLAETLNALPVNSVISDPSTGKTLTVVEAAPASAPGERVVYYVQGRLTPEQERALAEQRAAPPAGADRTAGAQNAGRGETAPQSQVTLPGVGTTQDLVRGTINSINQLPIDQRNRVLGQMMREFRRSLSPEERNQLRFLQQNSQQRRTPRGR